MENVKAVLFDMDGVLLDSEIPAFIMFQESLKSVGIEVPLEELISYIGKTSLEIADLILKRNESELTAEEFIKIHRSRGNFYAVSDSVVPYDNELDFIQDEFDVTIHVTLYFTDRDCCDTIQWTVGAKRVRCFRMNNIEDMCGFEVPYETQYAMKLDADGNIVVQYGRLDNRQINLAYYTTLGYAQ